MSDAASDTSGDDSKYAHPVVPIVLGILIIAGGGYLYYSGSQAIADAEEVDATVISSAVVYDDNSENSDSAKYGVAIEYRYSYDGETYTSRSLCPGVGSACEPSSEFRTEMQEFLDDYPEGGTVTAYVQPSNPSKAHLVESSPSLVYLGVSGIGVLLVYVGIRRLV